MQRLRRLAKQVNIGEQARALLTKLGSEQPAASIVDWGVYRCIWCGQEPHVRYLSEEFDHLVSTEFYPSVWQNVPVGRIVGIDNVWFSHYNPDWTPKTTECKLPHLLQSIKENGFNDSLWNNVPIVLEKLGEQYWVTSNGTTRTAAAHLLSIPTLRAIVDIPKFPRKIEEARARALARVRGDFPFLPLSDIEALKRL